MESVSFCKDDYVYFQGDDATQFYIVVEGTLLQYSDHEASSKPEKASGAKIQRTTSQTIKETRLIPAPPCNHSPIPLGLHPTFRISCR